MRKIVYVTIFTKFALDTVAWPSSSVSFWVSSLYHKALNNSMKYKSIIKTFFH